VRGLGRSSRVNVVSGCARAVVLAVVVPVLAALATALAVPVTASAASDGPVAWGEDAVGQLGNGIFGPENDCYTGSGRGGGVFPVPCSRFPVEVKGLKEAPVTALAGGGAHSLALLTDGMVMAWGGNFYGQLGDGANGEGTSSNVPVEVQGLKEVTAIASGGEHSLALLKSGTVMTWGENRYGQLGDGNETNSDVPVEVKGLTEVATIAGGRDHGLAARKDGTVFAWGDNSDGQLGDGVSGEGTNSSVPVQVKGLTEATALAAGERDSLALLKGGRVMAWGNNLGNGTEGASDVPVEVTGLKEVIAIAAGERHSLALLKDGTVWAWGENASGQLGDGNNTSTTLPVEVKGLKEVTAIAAGGLHSLALLKDGKVMVWGDNQFGQLGDGAATGTNVPVEAKGVQEVTAIAGGDDHSLVLGTQLFGPPPRVTGLSPNRGAKRGGTLVTIAGSGFVGVTRVMFGSAKALIKSSSESSVTVESPSGAGSVHVTVTTPTGTSPTSGRPTNRITKFKYTRK
jgi:alpha-tubulin suppressor-like RCC1 family protein